MVSQYSPVQEDRHHKNDYSIMFRIMDGVMLFQWLLSINKVGLIKKFNLSYLISISEPIIYGD